MIFRLFYDLFNTPCTYHVDRNVSSLDAIGYRTERLFPAACYTATNLISACQLEALLEACSRRALTHTAHVDRLNQLVVRSSTIPNAFGVDEHRR
jgi:hypothetical protein